MKTRKIRFLKKPRLKSPFLIAAWPGMGNVAIRAVEFLWECLQPKEFAEIRPEGLFYPHEAWIVNSQIEFPRLPSGKFFYWPNPHGKHDLILFLCEAQPAQEKGYEYAHYVLDVAQACNVKRIFTFASMPTPIDHTQDSQVWATATDKRLLKEVSKIAVKHLRVGQISGLNGLLLSVAKERAMDGLCLLGEIPLYAIQIENPRASKAVLSVFGKLLNLSFDFVPLDERAKLVEEEIEKLIDYFKTGAAAPGPISEEEIEKIKKNLASVTKIPESVKERIEEMFRTAERDLSKATDLKNELDRWNIYKEYEDRFLDLFRPHRKTDN
ncbi:MAG: PAC2 family protein [Candidatus Omnitrophica bacterium]|nr:PAC2 family protein [Candidatus Omnitrophota bacterium]